MDPLAPFTLSAQIYLVVFALGAAALAMWLHMRFPTAGPKGIVGVAIHLVAAGAGAHVITVLAYRAASTPPAVLAATLGLALPAVVYLFVAAIWLLRLSQGVLSRYSR